ncbi:hypothetical protein F9K33_16120 [bacterium]|nr:MAG: hypothetical protein F9K33_16120 [bacterium]
MIFRLLIFVFFSIGCAGSITNYDTYSLRIEKSKEEVLNNFSKSMRFHKSDSLEPGYLSKSQKYVEVDTALALSKGTVYRLHDLTIREKGRTTYLDIDSDSLYLKTTFPQPVPLLDFVFSKEDYYLRGTWHDLLAKGLSQEAQETSENVVLKKKSPLVAFSVYVLSPTIGKVYEYNANPIVTRRKALQQLLLPTLIDGVSLFLALNGKKELGIEVFALNRLFFWSQNDINLYNRFASTPYGYSNNEK